MEEGLKLVWLVATTAKAAIKDANTGRLVMFVRTERIDPVDHSVYHSSTIPGYRLVPILFTILFTISITIILL